MTHSLLRMAEACDGRATLIEAKSHARGESSLVDPVDVENRDDLRAAAALLRTLATSDVEGVAERLDQIAGPESSIARTAALLLRASAAREAEAVESVITILEEERVRAEDGVEKAQRRNIGSYEPDVDAAVAQGIEGVLRDLIERIRARRNGGG